MHKVGVISVWIGIILTVIGLFVGFPMMFMEHPLAMPVLMVVPFGFVFGFGGLVTVLMTAPDTKRTSSDLE
jgi:hypothetical protein